MLLVTREGPQTDVTGVTENNSHHYLGGERERGEGRGKKGGGVEKQRGKRERKGGRERGRENGRSEKEERGGVEKGK